MDKFDSSEELHFSWFLEELKDKGYISDWDKNEYSYELSTPLVHKYIKPMKKVPDKNLEQTILNGSVYTPDFIIYWTPKAIGIFVSVLGNTKGKITTPFICFDDDQKGLVSIIETKADFDRNNMTRLAKNNIKFVYEKYNVYINLVKLPSLFNKTFTPDRFFMTDRTFKPRKIKYDNVRTIREFVKSISK